MPPDRSLDEFLSAGSDGESDADADDRDSDPGSGGSDPEAQDVEPEEPVEEATDEPETPTESASDVEPMAATYAWSPDGGECGACGETVDARWRDGEDLVCRDCKNW